MEREKARSKDKWESGRISVVEKKLPETHERRRLCLFSVFGALSHRDAYSGNLSSYFSWALKSSLCCCTLFFIFGQGGETPGCTLRLMEVSHHRLDST